jgi:hypothetical protein
MSVIPLRSGVHLALEEAADELIRQDLKRHTRHSDNDVLTPWKEMSRRKREVYVASGVPDPAVRRGCFHRSVNSARPELNSREGIAPPRHSGTVGDSPEDWADDE